MDSGGPMDSISDVVAQVEALLKPVFADAFLLSQSGEAGGRYHSLSAGVINIQRMLQPFGILAGLGPGTLTPGVAPPPQSPAPPPPAPGPQREAGKVRRAKSYGFDFMLLEMVSLRVTIGQPVGLAQLHAAAEHLEPGTQRNSLTAKLNRWRSPAGFLAWTRADDMMLTEAGIAEKFRLLPHARREGRMADVAAAIDHALGIRPSYD